MSDTASRKLAIVTGGSSGIGYELAKQFTQNGFDVIIAADRNTAQAGERLKGADNAAKIETIEVDLSSKEGVQKLYDNLKEKGRKIDALAANAGIGHGHSFFDQSREDWLKIIETNVIGTLDLIHLVGKDMREAGHGRILITSSIASQMPGAFNAVYNSSKAFLQSFSFAIRNELKDSGVSVTALLPGPTETEFFERADMDDTEVGQAKKDDPADVAKTGFEALMRGDGDVVYGLKNKMEVMAAKIIPDERLAEKHRGMSAPGTGQH